MPFAVALAVSVVLHAAAIIMPGWTLPGDNGAEPPLEAELAPPPPAPKPVPLPPKPKPHPRRVRHAEPAQEAPAVQPVPADTAAADAPAA
ncbi:MAG TPA: DUF3108 domain-containing protein, partial [Rhodocyclaceae bacterium]